MKLDVMESELKNIHLRCRRRVVTASWINEPPRSKLPSAAQHCAVRLLWEGDEKKNNDIPKTPSPNGWAGGSGGWGAGGPVTSVCRVGLLCLLPSNKLQKKKSSN